MASIVDPVSVESSVPSDSLQVNPVAVNTETASGNEKGSEPAAKKAKVEEKQKTPKKRGLSQTERTQREAEALIGELKSDTLDGPRRTRSQTRGTPAPSILEKISPARASRPRKEPGSTPSPKKSPAASAPARGRGRGAKKNVNASQAATNAAEEQAGEQPTEEEASKEAVNENGLPEVSEPKEEEVAQNPAADEEDPWEAEAKREDAERASSPAKTETISVSAATTESS